jgi:hypothetical protein
LPFGVLHDDLDAVRRGKVPAEVVEVGALVVGYRREVPRQNNGTDGFGRTTDQRKDSEQRTKDVRLLRQRARVSRVVVGDVNKARQRADCKGCCKKKINGEGEEAMSGSAESRTG